MPDETSRYIPPVDDDLPEYLKGLASRAMLASVRIGSWRASKIDQQITREIAAQHNADGTRAGKYRKKLMECDELKALMQVRSALRREHHERTARFGDMEGRLLPVQAYDAYAKVMDKLISDYTDAREAFLAVYEQRIEDQRAARGSMWNRDDYPSAEEIRDNVRAEYVIDPIPTGDHFMAEVVHEQAERRQVEINHRVAKCVADSSTWCLEQLLDALERVTDRLSDEPDADGKMRIFRDSLVGGTRQVAESMLRLNVAGNKTVADLSKAVIDALEGVEAGELRPHSPTYSPNKREKVRTTAEAIRAEAAEKRGAFAPSAGTGA